ncbi:hypothetical protein GQ42DRAFT_161721 [Ramicandelaber brevisporus]|nr:hypothetical protein GQ42DRAFT_161721 [Ramicandelaber brevisporus]
MRAFASLLCLFAAVASATPLDLAPLGGTAAPVRADIDATVKLNAKVNVHIGGSPYHCEKLAAAGPTTKRDVDVKANVDAVVLINLGPHRYSCLPGLLAVDADVKADVKANADLGIAKVNANVNVKVKANVDLVAGLLIGGKQHECKLPGVATLKKRHVPITANVNVDANIVLAIDAIGVNGVLGVLTLHCRPLVAGTVVAHVKADADIHI